jgi:ABC-2 type transport system permease protein
MNKILLIIQREYLTRVRKKSFIIMTILGPLLMGVLFLAPVMLAKFGGDEIYRIKIIDQHPSIFSTRIANTDKIVFENDTATDINTARKNFDPDVYYGLLYIPADLLKNPNGALLYTEKQANMQVTTYIEETLKEQIEKDKLKSAGISEKTIRDAVTDVNLRTLTMKGKENSAALNTVVGFVGAVLIYMFIFLYGVQVMKGVIEEKTSRIVEVIISSVKPFQLMMGKIIGIAMVGLTQFGLWIVLTLLITSVAGSLVTDRMNAEKVAQEFGQRENPIDQMRGMQNVEKDAPAKILESLESVNFPLIITCFLIYFLGGYLLYSALFAAIGAAVDNETETQQFMLPVTIPLIFAFIVAQTMITNPDSQLGFWFSLFPLTSPVVMMVRIAFGVPAWELILSIGLLIAGFLGATWLAGKIYRTGILLYGKKINYRELVRWLFYKP